MSQQILFHDGTAENGEASWTMKYHRFPFSFSLSDFRFPIYPFFCSFIAASRFLKFWPNT
jgi:hypothetical protein